MDSYQATGCEVTNLLTSRQLKAHLCWCEPNRHTIIIHFISVIQALMFISSLPGNSPFLPLMRLSCSLSSISAITLHWASYQALTLVPAFSITCTELSSFPCPGGFCYSDQIIFLSSIWVKAFCFYLLRIFSTPSLLISIPRSARDCCISVKSIRPVEDKSADALKFNRLRGWHDY